MRQPLASRKSLNAKLSFESQLGIKPSLWPIRHLYCCWTMDDSWFVETSHEIANSESARRLSKSAAAGLRGNVSRSHSYAVAHGFISSEWGDLVQVAEWSSVREKWLGPEQAASGFSAALHELVHNRACFDTDRLSFLAHSFGILCPWSNQTTSDNAVSRRHAHNPQWQY